MYRGRQTDRKDSTLGSLKWENERRKNFGRASIRAGLSSANPIISRPTGRTNFQCHYLAQRAARWCARARARIVISSSFSLPSLFLSPPHETRRGRPFSTWLLALARAAWLPFAHQKREAATLATVSLLLNYKRPVALMDRSAFAFHPSERERAGYTHLVFAQSEPREYREKVYNAARRTRMREIGMREREREESYFARSICQSSRSSRVHCYRRCCCCVTAASF